MSSTIDIIFERKVRKYSPEDRCRLADVFFEPEFEALAKRLGVSPLTEFYSDDPDSLDDCFDDDFFDDPKELEALKKKMGPKEYFDATTALKSITALRDHLKRTPLEKTKSGREFGPRLVDELTEVERSLNKAKVQGIKFYFVLTPG